MRFEFPLNQNYRDFLKIEQAFNRIDALMRQNNSSSFESALMILVNLLEFLNRIDIKNEIIKELDYQQKRYAGLLSHPDIDSKKLSMFLSQLETLLNWTIKHKGKFSDNLKQDPFFSHLMSKLIGNTGITSAESTDIISFLSKDPSIITSTLQSWLKTLEGLSTSVRVLLRLSREMSVQYSETAQLGDFYIDSPPEHTRLIQIDTLNNAHIVPEITANKHRVCIHFFSLNKNFVRVKSRDSIEFKYFFCGWLE